MHVNTRYFSTHKYYTLYNGIHYLYRSVSIVSILCLRNAWSLEALYVDSEIYLSLNLPLACRIKYVTIMHSFKHSFLESLYASFYNYFVYLKRKQHLKKQLYLKAVDCLFIYILHCWLLSLCCTYNWWAVLLCELTMTDCYLDIDCRTLYLHFKRRNVYLAYNTKLIGFANY